MHKLMNSVDIIIHVQVSLSPNVVPSKKMLDNQFCAYQLYG